MFESLLGSLAGSLGDSVMSGLGSGISSAIGGLFGGKSKGPSLGQQMKMQYDYQLQGMLDAPRHQVAGLRMAGLNPILAATNGPGTTQQVSASGTDDRVVGLQEASVKSQIANQSAQAALYAAQARKTEAETKSELKRPENISADTATKTELIPKLQQETRTSYAAMQREGSTSRLQDQLARTEEWKTKKSIADFFFRELEYELAKSNMGPRQAAEIRKISAEARSAETEADLNESIRELERKLGMVGQAAGLVRGVLGKR